MAEQLEEKVTFDGKKVKVLGPTFEEGKARDSHQLETEDEESG